MIVWVIGTEDHGNPGDQRLHGYNGDTGAIIYGGGGANELMTGTHFYSTTGIAARGRIYVAGDNKVYAFAVPGGTPTPTPTASPTPTPTATPTSTGTATPTVTPTATAPRLPRQIHLVQRLLLGPMQHRGRVPHRCRVHKEQYRRSVGIERHVLASSRRSVVQCHSNAVSPPA